MMLRNIPQLAGFSSGVGIKFSSFSLDYAIISNHISSVSNVFSLKMNLSSFVPNGKKINIAIDGYSSSGKSSLARAISKEFKMKYIDTGAMYRSITYLLLKNSIDSSNFVESEKKVDELINNCKIEYNYNFKKNISETILNGARCDEHIRKNYVSEFVSIVSKSKKVRDFMIAKQKKLLQIKMLLWTEEI